MDTPNPLNRLPEDMRYYPKWDIRRGGWEISGNDGHLVPDERDDDD